MRNPKTEGVVGALGGIHAWKWEKRNMLIFTASHQKVTVGLMIRSFISATK